MNFQHTNDLINSTSPYLLQHAHNPVNWIAWDDDMIKNSDLSGKLLLVSIGYAACHWCHVMEKESFENEDVARIMNEFFVCIKVDREERPDVDHFYMTAIHLMGMQGGWPLNVIALPDGRPIWGGTYFQAQAWVDQIVAVADFWQHNRDKAIAYAEKLQAGIEATVLNVQQETGEKPGHDQVEKAIDSWKKRFDFEYGGMKGRPKFPMPVNLNFLLYYGALKSDSQILDFVQLTLVKMAFGGIFDQIGGGFARYSTDEKWKVPHFEKMLYDNGQLLSLYSNAFRKFKTEDFKAVVYLTAEFIERELMSPEGAFYSSLDADSEGSEGKFYVWTREELADLPEEDFELFSQYYNINSIGLWEDGNYILLREMNLEDFTARHDLSAAQFSEKVAAWRKLLMQKRSSRVRPTLDDKTLLSWNALVITGLTDAFKAFGDPYFKRLALKNAEFLRDNMILENGAVYHSWKNGRSNINGFLDDYALFVQAGLAVYEITGEENWLDLADKVLRFAIENFYDKNSGLFYYALQDPAPTITNHFQTEDNVIPAANSVMANNLHAFYLLTADIDKREMQERMVSQTIQYFQQYPYAFANWGSLLLKQTGPYFEVAVSGKAAEVKIGEMQSLYLPNVLWAFAKGESSVPLLKNKYVAGETFIYVCREGSCRLPVKEVSDAVRQIRSD